MNQEIYADAISAVHVTGSIVRIDLMTLQPQLKSENGQPVVDISRRLIMPLDGFVQSLNVQDNIVKQLLEAGVLTKNLAVSPAVAVTQAAAAQQTEPAGEPAGTPAAVQDETVVHLVTEKG